jgi:hypothetical protein
MWGFTTILYSDHLSNSLRGGKATMSKVCNLLAVTLVVLGGASMCAGSVVVDYTTIPDGNAPSYNLGGTTVTGSAKIVSASFVGFRGLGVMGGGSDVSLDIGENMTIDFNQLAKNQTLTLVDIDPPGNVTFSFEAFAGGHSIGSFALPHAVTAPETYDLFALCGNQAFDKFTIFVSAPSPPLGLQIEGVTYDAAVPTVPEPATVVIWSLLGGLGIAVARLRRRKSA